MKNKLFCSYDIPLVLIYSLRLFYPYRPMLDDYIQYHVYSLHANPIRDIFFGIGLFAARPAASFLDITLWSRFWEHLWILYALFSLLYLVSLCALRFSLLRCGVHLGSVFMYFTALCPLNIEGTMWLSASTRIVGGLCASVVAISLISEKNSLLNKIAFVILCFLSYCFYEQTAVFCFVTVCFVSFAKRRPFYAMAAVVNLCFLAAWYLCFSRFSVFGFRAAVTAENIFSFPFRLARCTAAAACTFTDCAWIMYLLPLPFAALWLCGFDKPCADRLKFWYGAAVSLASFAPLVISGGNVPFRCLIVPLIGLFVLLDCIGGSMRRIFLCTVCSVFIIVSANEFCSYYQATVLDEKFLDGLCERITNGGEYDISSAPLYYSDSPSNHAEHIAAVTSSDWALTGAVRARLDDVDFPLIKVRQSGSF